MYLYAVFVSIDSSKIYLDRPNLILLQITSFRFYSNASDNSDNVSTFVYHLIFGWFGVIWEIRNEITKSVERFEDLTGFHNVQTY